MSRPGTEAIDAHVDAADGGRPEERWTPHRPHRSSDEGPLAEVTGHTIGPSPAEGIPGHWHLVTYGLSEVEGKESPDPEISGWGFELTFRLAGTGDDPEWAVGFLTNLANYVWTSGNAMAPGHHLDLRGPIDLSSPSALTAAAVITDPGLGDLEGPNGWVEFLQVVGLTADELELCRSWRTDEVMALLARGNPLLVTDTTRPSLLGDPETAAEVARRAAADGSALTELRVGTLQWRTRIGGGAVVEMGAGASAALGPALRRELIAPGASFVVEAPAQQVRFAVGDQAAWAADGDCLQVAVPLEEVAGLASLFDGRAGSGRRAALPGLRFRVVP